MFGKGKKERLDECINYLRTEPKVVWDPYPRYDQRITDLLLMTKQDKDYSLHYEEIKNKPLSELDLNQIATMFTFIARGERFSDGHIAGFVESGKLLILAERFRELKYGTPKSSRKIKSFTTVYLRITAMRFTSEYEILMKDGNADISEYDIRYAGEDQRILLRHAVCSEEIALDLFNKCDILSWNGFKGPHPKGVLDGIMFEFNAVFNEETKISASGSENFPKHYHDFVNGLRDILKEANDIKKTE